tara:strand:- start:416 stop:565 length:150 start_codon:yes stop_codon:yes gene_type:complete
MSAFYDDGDGFGGGGGDDAAAGGDDAAAPAEGVEGEGDDDTPSEEVPTE